MEGVYLSLDVKLMLSRLITYSIHCRLQKPSSWNDKVRTELTSRRILHVCKKKCRLPIQKCVDRRIRLNYTSSSIQEPVAPLNSNMIFLFFLFFFFFLLFFYNFNAKTLKRAVGKKKNIYSPPPLQPRSV